MGIGASVLQESVRTNAGAGGVRTVLTAGTGLEISATNVGLDELECSRWDTAQQESACPCVSCRWESDPWRPPLCIGHSCPLAQHDIRASGVGSQPAQTARLPAARASRRNTTDSRLVRSSTHLRMLDEPGSVKRGSQRHC